MERPTEQELRERITEHLAHYGNNEASNLLWAGYLAGLLEWGLLPVGVYDDLRDLLKDVGEAELRSVFLGFYTGEEDDEPS